ncbi:MAG: formylmethanofuran dehydrogenase subunit E family protein [Candidatus Thermoplasmatota archaeon]
MDETLKKIEAFHGHIGPYAVIGYRMGKIACRKLTDDPFSKKVKIMTGTKPPISCIIDGIQVSSGCTLGKGNIKIQDKKQPIAIFKDNKGTQITITLKKDIYEKIETAVRDEELLKYSEEIHKKPEEEIFKIK